LIAPSVFSSTYLSCVLCTLCCQFLSIVLFFITPSVFSKIYLSCVLCTLCCQFLWIVLVYSPVGILQHLFVMCRLYPMLPVSLDCPFSLPLRYSLTFICPVSCVPYVASFSGLSFFITLSVFSNMYLSCALCTLFGEYRRGNQKWTIQRNCQHRVHKTQDKYMLENTERVIKKDNPEKLAT
jgi:hypothetical protein